ncbi:MAG: hypothetical protein U0M60_07605 [Clostridia bacterium]|nr:hypothetical protein [Clostridia bacterium]
MALGLDAKENILDDGELLLYNDYINLNSMRTNNEQRGSFTTKGKNYKNSFVRVKTENPKEIKYNVITDVTAFGENFQVEYTVNNGAVSFKFEDNEDCGSILWCGGGKTVAKAIYDATKKLSQDNFFGRTVDGVNAELQLHYVAYKAGILREKASPANIGGMKAPGPDSNAWLFEGIQLAEDIVNPKATDVVKAVKEIWRYYK